MRNSCHDLHRVRRLCGTKFCAGLCGKIAVTFSDARPTFRLDRFAFARSRGPGRVFFGQLEEFALEELPASALSRRFPGFIPFKG